MPHVLERENNNQTIKMHKNAFRVSKPHAKCGCESHVLDMDGLYCTVQYNSNFGMSGLCTLLE